jgi:F-type H+-transporting ATPase subunit epsilon
MPDTLTLEIVTPEAVQRFDGVEIVTLPGIVGQMGVYPHHVALMTQMVPGEIMVRKDGHEVFIATGGGLIEVTSKRVSVLTDLAVQADRIDEAKAEEARLRAEARLHEKLSAEEVASVNASLARSLAQLRVKRRQRR